MMTDNKHPIIPPTELVQQWIDEIHGGSGVFVNTSDKCLAELAAYWAANQELKACCEWMVNKLTFREDGIRFADELRAARRPKPPSLKEHLKKAILDGDERLALKLLEQLSDD